MRGGDLCLRPEGYVQGASREWLVANGIGGYASSTAVGANTRAYHGLLVASFDPPSDRWLLLSSLDEEIDGVSLACHQYPGVIHPQGFLHLRSFALDPLPRFSYQVGEARIEKTVFMIHGENTTLVRYRILDGSGVMRIHPLVHCRGFHAASALPGIRQEPRGAGTVLSSSRRLILLSDGACYIPEERIYYRFEYEQERLRGLPWREDLLCPGMFEIRLSGDDEFSIVASTWRASPPDLREEMERAEERVKGLRCPIPWLAQAADSFIVRRGEKKSIIAGYHWFGDWGRDAMISLPGLLLLTGRIQDARAVLITFASAMREGVLPNDLSAGSYNTVDASLWFIRALACYLDWTGDKEFIRRLWPAAMDVVRRYSSEGEGFWMDSDSLISSGPALTWMDARVLERPVVPRAGKCCEINALWYSSLAWMGRTADLLGFPFDGSLAERVRESYQRFWNSDEGCLFDVIDPEDGSVRPNQIVAASIPGLLPETKRRRILDVVTRELLTPFGLRTLSPRDPRYIGRFEGGPAQRDEAYHQGTAWPWLLGPYVDALLSLDSTPGGRSRALEVLRPILELDGPGVGTIPEVFDGSDPQRAGGCISQAWSVAEVIRAWWRASLHGRMRSEEAGQPDVSGIS
ncbi:MAG: amylo-alpha-1,6-glucosidase [Methanothrix sp.]|nr:amylo-alpha-1,6-glucosidase [Methanothrix sp.]